MLRKKASALRQLLMSVLVRSLQPEEESGSVDRAAVEISKFAHALLQLVPLSRWLVAEEAPAVAHAVESIPVAAQALKPVVVAKAIPSHCEEQNLHHFDRTCLNSNAALIC